MPKRSRACVHMGGAPLLHVGEASLPHVSGAIPIVLASTPYRLGVREGFQ